MKYGMNLLLWTAACDDSVFPLLEQIRGWGFDGVELPIFDLKPDNFGRVGQKLDALGLERTAVTICTPAENPISPDPATRQAALRRLKLAIDCTAAAGGQLLCGPIHSALGEFSGRGRTDEEWTWAQETLAAAADYARRQNVVLAIEALNRFECYFLNSVGDAARFCREVHHPNLMTMYDTFHAHIEEKNAGAAITACADQLAHVHVSENDRSTPGEGQVRWHDTFQALKQVKYDGWLTIEAFGLALPDLAAATKIWRRMFPTEQHVAQQGLEFIKKMQAA